MSKGGQCPRAGPPRSGPGGWGRGGRRRPGKLGRVAPRGDDSGLVGARGNYWRIVDLLGQHITLTRSELGKALDLSPTTVSGVVKQLIARGVVAEEPAARRLASQGRHAQRLQLVGPDGPIGVIAQSHDSLAVAIATFQGHLKSVFRLPAEWRSSPSYSAKQGLQVLDGLLAGANLRRIDLSRLVVGLPMPYPSHQTAGGPWHSHFTAADRRGAGAGYEADVAHAVRELVGDLKCPVSIENDANLGALGEALFGAGRGAESLAYVKLAHDIGAGLVVRGRLFRGADGLAGELAHVPVDPDGPPCPCGGRGHLCIVAGPPLRKYFKDLRTSVPEVATAAPDGQTSYALPRQPARALGFALAGFCAMFNPRALVLDGTCGDRMRGLLETVAETLAVYCPLCGLDLSRVLLGTLGADAELYGAVALARNAYTEDLASQ